MSSLDNLHSVAYIGGKRPINAFDCGPSRPIIKEKSRLIGVLVI